MNGFVDLHTHILPATDDGAPDMTQALKMLRVAWNAGTRTVFLTPHYRGKYRQNTPSMLLEKLEWLRDMAASEFPGMQLCLGQEICYETEVPEALLDGRLLTMNGSQYVLLEFRTNSLRSQIISGVSETLLSGFIPIVAHIERYEISRKDPTLVDELLHMGTLLQLNADSVLGENGFFVKRFCHKLLNEQKVHFIASDSHDVKYRPPRLRDCFLQVHKKYGRDYAAKLFWENAQLLIESRKVE